MSQLQQITDTSFEQKVLSSDIPVLVDFGAEWCRPCKVLEPTLVELADEMNGKVQIAKLDVDENQKIAVQFGVRGVPTLILFKNGRAVDQLVGRQSKEVLKGFIEGHL